MKKLILITISIVIFSQSNSQFKASGLEGKRWNIEAGVGLSLFPGLYLFSDGNTINSGALGEYVSSRPNFELGYSLTNKIKVSLMYSFFKRSYESTSTYDSRVVDNGFRIDHIFEDAKFNSYGFKFNYYLHDFIAPVGGSIGLSFKKNYLTLNNSILERVELSEDNNGYYREKIYKETISDVKMNYSTLGFHYENNVFLSSKIPLYLKYGISTSFSFGKTGENNGIEMDLDKTINKEFFQILTHQTRYEMFEFNFGIGIIL